MNEQELTYKVLNHFFPNECAIIGNSDVIAISSGIDKTVKTTGGSNFDISEIVKLLIEAVGLVKIIIEARSALKKKGEVPLQKDETPSGKISKERINEIYEYIENEMENKKIVDDSKE